VKCTYGDHAPEYTRPAQRKSPSGGGSRAFYIRGKKIAVKGVERDHPPPDRQIPKPKIYPPKLVTSKQALH